MKHLGLILLFTIFSLFLFAQQNEGSSKVEVSWFGYIKSDFFTDSRQTINAREGHLLLYPANIKLDVDGKDINDRGSFNFLSIQSRFGTKINGPDAFGAKTHGLLEGAYFGHTESDVNGFRLRHAFVELDWGKTQLLLGQYWHLLFIPDCFPGTVSFNTGIPFQFFSRNPQIRITHTINELTFIGVLASHRDFQGPTGYQELSNTMIPDFHGQLQWNPNKNILLATTFGYKRALPRLQTLENYKVDESFGSISFNLFSRITSGKLTTRIQALWAQNAYDGLMIGGYVVNSIVDAEKDIRLYTPINTFSIWSDMETTYPRINGGLFLAYSENMGSFTSIDDIAFLGLYSRGSNIDYLYRIAPRIVINSGKVRIAGEIEYTAAAYASVDAETGLRMMDDYGRVSESNTVGNLRFLLGVYYFF